MADIISSREPPEATTGPSALVRAYLLDHLDEYRELAELRKKGWENESGDSYFKNQRFTADFADKKTRNIFFNLMSHIAAELDAATSAFNLSPTSGSNPAVLDLCMAPGGFALFALEANPSARIRGISLPIADGGHEILIPNWEANDRIDVQWRDITMLAADMGVDGPSAIPAGHPDAGRFSFDRPFAGQEFDLVFCDGMVLRQHARAAYRENREATRLLTAQLALALSRLRDGGSMVCLLHKADAWDSVALLRVFSSFAAVRVVKPQRAHRMRSSFYLVALGVRTSSGEAKKAVEGWKALWRVATFGTQEEYEAARDTTDEEVVSVLGEFGPELVRMARPVFAIQAEALRSAPFIKERGPEVQNMGRDVGNRMQKTSAKPEWRDSPALSKSSWRRAEPERMQNWRPGAPRGGKDSSDDQVGDGSSEKALENLRISD